MGKTIIKGGTVYYNGTFQCLDIAICRGIVCEICEDISPSAENKLIDAAGLLVLPSFVDMHCHLRDPGFTHKENIESGLKSAIAGGFTTVCCMPNTNPVIDSTEILEYIINTAKLFGIADLLPIAAITKNMDGTELVDFSKLSRYAVAFSDDGKCLKNSNLMTKGTLLADEHGKFLISHCEDDYLLDSAATDGRFSKLAEDIIVAREIAIAGNFDKHIHLAHVSTKHSVSLIRNAKKEGIKVTAETCPHYFSLTSQDIDEHGTNAKINPPLRNDADRIAIIKGIEDGTIDVIATDHAPHTKEEKDQNFLLAPSGIIGFETAFALSYTELCKKYKLPLERVVDALTNVPAKILSADTGKIALNKPADLAIVDINNPYVYKNENIVSMSKNTPFVGKKLHGKVVYTIYKGEIVYSNKEDLQSE